MQFSLNVYINIFYTPYNLKYLLCFKLFRDIFNFFSFFSLNVNKMLFIGLKSLTIKYKAPIIYYYNGN